MIERFTAEARRSLELASAVATGRGDPAIGPSHLLAGLANSGSGLACDLLAEAGVDEAAVTAAMPPAPGGAGPMTPPFTADAKKALELSLREALNLAHGHIGSGHLLLGLLRLDDDGAAAFLAEQGITLDATRDVVRRRSEGARLGGRRRPRRTGRIVEAPTPHEQLRAAGAAAASARAEAATASDEDVAVRLASAEGSRLQRALASLGVTAEELQAALSEVAAEPVDDGPVEIDLGAGATLAVAGGPRAAELRALVGSAPHVTASEGPDGTLRLEAAALGHAVWATLEGWLTA